MTKNELEFELNASNTALAAILHEAHLMGVDLDHLVKQATSGLFDSSKPYRWASPKIVMPALKCIDAALGAVRE